MRGLAGDGGARVGLSRSSTVGPWSGSEGRKWSSALTITSMVMPPSMLPGSWLTAYLWLHLPWSFVVCTDEAAGIARIEMAKQSKARRAREAAELKKRNKEMKARIAANRKTQRTDDDLDDEEAGKMRAVMAQQSKDRRAKEANALSSKNQTVFLSIRNQGTRSDDDIMGACLAQVAMAVCRALVPSLRHEALSPRHSLYPLSPPAPPPASLFSHLRLRC